MNRRHIKTAKTTLILGLALILTAIANAAAGSSAAGEPGSPLDAVLEARRSIAEVYWKHREWPSSNPQAKPALTAILSDAAILAEWRKSEFKRELLASRWGVVVTGEMLQAEMRRIAKNTKDPQRLQELFATLDNDPRAIAEYLVQPVLVDRLLLKAFRKDSRIHDQTRAAIDEAWKRADSPTAFRALASPDEIVQRRKHTDRSTSAFEGSSRAEGFIGDQQLFDDEWTSMLDALRKDLGVEVLREGLVSPLLEDETSFFRVAVEQVDDSSITLIQKRWRKPSLESWLDRQWARSRSQVMDKSPLGANPSTMQASLMPESEPNDEIAPIEAPLGGFEIPDLSESLAANDGCTDDSWRGPLQQQPDARWGHTAVWTGTEMIIWGGFHRGTFTYDSGGRYDPVIDTWIPVTKTGAPSPRGHHTAVWTGTEMLVWGGGADEAGGRYDPVSNTWTAMSTTGAPPSRDEHVAVWSGSEMIVWGGWGTGGGRYDPATDSWAPMSEVDGALSEPNSTAVWTGTAMIVWGGGSDASYANSYGSSYDPDIDTWTPLPYFPEEDRVFHSAVWTGTEMIIWAGQGLVFDPDLEEEIEVPLSSGAMYDPSTDSWTSIFGPYARYQHTAVWTGSQMLIYGGEEAGTTAEEFDPVTQSFFDLPPDPFVFDRTDHTAVWTGNEMIIWGGVEVSTFFTPEATGEIWTPSLGMWSEPYASPAPSPRAGHTAVWTGSEMIIFGGRGAFGDFETGRRYDPALDDWRPYSHTNVPTFRQNHSAVWTGTEMIVWGGTLDTWENTGGRYDPTTDTWTSTTLTNAPAGREYHSATWSGSEMLIWGGTGDFPLDDGARYDPVADSWTPMSATNALSARRKTPFVWTGSQAFLWGGVASGGYLNDGRLYDPVADTWTTISATGAPDARAEHAAVWTGSEVVLWGGNDGTGGADTGAHYDPSTDTWTPTPVLDAPAPRTLHTAVWSGEEMLVWGGRAAGGQIRDTGGRYDPVNMVWTPMTTAEVPTGRYGHSAVWAGTEMLVWGGRVDNTFFNPDHGGYCASTACTASEWYRDDDGDGYGDSSDSISACEQPAGYAGLPGDCNDGDGTVYGRPGETRNTTLTHDTGTSVTTIEWLAPTDLGGTPGSESYDLLRSSQAADFNTNTTCLETMSSSTTSTDAETPAPGSAFFYLSRARNACPSEGVGSLGSASTGSERSGTACP